MHILYRIEKETKKEKKEADDNAEVKEVIEIGSDASTKTEVKDDTSGEAVAKENDIISSENMEIDDKE